MVKDTQTIRRFLPTNCLSVFDRFVGLALKGLIGDTKTKVEVLQLKCSYNTEKGPTSDVTWLLGL